MRLRILFAKYGDEGTAIPFVLLHINQCIKWYFLPPPNAVWLEA